MPYKQIADLPDSVKENLPNHAQEIFQAAFNSAEEQYGEEESAFRVAWSAVKRDYEKATMDNGTKNQNSSNYIQQDFYRHHNKHCQNNS